MQSKKCQMHVALWVCISPQVSALEQECEALSVNVRRTKQQHEEAMANLTQQHTAQVGRRSIGRGNSCSERVLLPAITAPVGVYSTAPPLFFA